MTTNDTIELDNTSTDPSVNAVKVIDEFDRISDTIRWPRIRNAVPNQPTSVNQSTKLSNHRSDACLSTQSSLPTKLTNHQHEIEGVKEFITKAEKMIGQTLTRMLVPLIEVKQAINPSITQSFSLSVRSMIILALITLLSLICLCSSVTLYSFIYHWSIPMLSINLPINFDYSMNQPVALISLTPQQWSSHQSSRSISHESVNPYDLFLTPNQHYHVSLKLDIPDTTINQNMGVITVHSQMQHRTLIDRLHKPAADQIHSLASSTRSFLVPYRNSLIQSINRLIWCVPMLLGLVDDSHIINLQLFDDFLESSVSQSTHLQIELATPRAHLLQIASASVQFDAHLTGVIRLMYHWPLITSLFIVSCLFTLQMVIVTGCLLVVAVMWHRKVNALALVDDEAEPGNELPPINYDTISKLPPITRAPKYHIS